MDKIIIIILILIQIYLILQRKYIKYDYILKKDEVSPLIAYKLYSKYVEKNKYSYTTVVFYTLLSNNLIETYNLYEKKDSVGIEVSKNNTNWIRENEKAFKLVSAEKIQSKMEKLRKHEKEVLLNLFKYKDNIFSNKENLYKIENILAKKNNIKTQYYNNYIYLIVFSIYFIRNSQYIGIITIIIIFLIIYNKLNIVYTKKAKAYLDYVNNIDIEYIKNITNYDEMIEEINKLLPYIFYRKEYKNLISFLEKKENKDKIYKGIHKEYYDNIDIVDYLAKGNLSTWN